MQLLQDELFDTSDISVAFKQQKCLYIWSQHNSLHVYKTENLILFIATKRILWRINTTTGWQKHKKTDSRPCDKLLFLTYKINKSLEMFIAEQTTARVQICLPSSNKT